MKRCFNCGAEMEDDDIFCMNCGAKNENGEKKETVPDFNPNTNGHGAKNEDSEYMRTTSVGETIPDFNPNTKAIRNYFNGSKKAKRFIILGIMTLVIIIGFVLIAYGIYLIYKQGYEGEKEVDIAEQKAINRLKKNYLEKINVDKSEIDIIDPVTVVGYGDEPHSSLSLTATDLSSLAKKKGLSKVVSKGLQDPIVAYKVGSDGYVRSLLLQVSTYAFSEDQLYVYTGNIDISTGMIYDEYTDEIFYKDITDIYMEESLAKVYDTKKKKDKYYKNQIIGLKGAGFNKRNSMKDSLNNDSFSTQFAAMRNLIRDKKRAN